MIETFQQAMREFNDRGLLWLLDYPVNLRACMNLHRPDLAPYFDFERAIRVNRSFIPDDLRKQEVDLLHRVPFLSQKGEVLLYHLVENQSAPDNRMALRLHSYEDAIWQMEQEVWRRLPVPRPDFRIHLVLPIVFYTGSDPWTPPIALESVMEFPPELHNFVPSVPYLLLSLRDLPESRLTERGSGFGCAMLALKYAEAPLETLEAVLEEAIDRLRHLPPHEREHEMALRYLILLVRHKRQVGEQEELLNIVYNRVDERLREEVRENIMTGAEYLLMQGEERGAILGQRKMLQKLLKSRFGKLSKSIQQKIDNLSEPQIEAAFHKLMTAQTLQEVGL